MGALRRPTATGAGDDDGGAGQRSAPRWWCRSRNGGASGHRRSTAAAEVVKRRRHRVTAHRGNSVHAAAHSADLAGVRNPAPAGLAGRGEAPARPPDANFQPIVVRDLRAVAVINGRSSKVVDAIVAFSEQSITASDSHNGTTVKTFAYSAVTHATVSRSRKPRGFGGAFVETPGGIPDGNIFSRGARLWVTLETADDRLVLRLDQDQLRPVAAWSDSAPSQIEALHGPGSAALEAVS